MNYRKIFFIMERIIYKDGCDGRRRLECIEGIEIDLLNGQKALIYPKYSNEELLDPKDRDRWHDAGISETAALGVPLPRLDSGGQRLRVWSRQG